MNKTRIITWYANWIDVWGENQKPNIQTLQDPALPPIPMKKEQEGTWRGISLLLSPLQLSK